ncbi:MAG: hypothetical protein OYG31_03360 [Candidatus Kaiserbacteria bacterium]|nr:hypothetical protein [Candidatus Kaiserbacteria bacterium]
MNNAVMEKLLEHFAIDAEDFEKWLDDEKRSATRKALERSNDLYQAVSTISVYEQLHGMADREGSADSVLQSRERYEKFCKDFVSE